MNAIDRATAALRALADGANRSAVLDAWWHRLEHVDGFPAVSAPSRFGGAAEAEAAYAQQFMRDQPLEQRIGSGLKRLLGSADHRAPALEIGAGTGTLSRPLIDVAPHPQIFITDPSPEFLRRTRDSVGSLGRGRQVDFGVLAADDLRLWPHNTLSLVVLRYTLHHVLDWERFIGAAARTLRPGGVLLCEEPCADGYVLQAGMATVLRHSPELMAQASDTVRRDLDRFVATTLFYARSREDKTAAEDKHVFSTYRLMDVCLSSGLLPRLYPNEGLDGTLKNPGSVASPFAAEFRHNLVVNFGFEAETIKFCERHLLPASEDLGGLPAAGGGPVVKAVLRAVKPPISAVPPRVGRALSRFVAQAATPAGPEPAPAPSAAPARAASGFTLALDYPPAASSSPRWGHGRPTHAELRRVLDEHAETYRRHLDCIVSYREALVAIAPVSEDPSQPAWKNGFLPGLDAAALYMFLRERRPRRYLEVGSGNSTKFAARAKRDGGLSTELVSIDPHPRAEIDALCESVIRAPLEEPAAAMPFAQLGGGDIVFFDGSHRVFTGSDVTVFFLEVLPRIPPGTLVGVHDIFLPDDYPADWADRYYSEQYLLAAYLLSGCSWIVPVLPAWYASTVEELQLALHPLWGDPHFEGIERHGGAFWFEVGPRT